MLLALNGLPLLKPYGTAFSIKNYFRYAGGSERSVQEGVRLIHEDRPVVPQGLFYYLLHYGKRKKL